MVDVALPIRHHVTPEIRAVLQTVTQNEVDEFAEFIIAGIVDVEAGLIRKRVRKELRPQLSNEQRKRFGIKPRKSRGSRVRK